MKIAITADSTIDLTPELLLKYDIKTINKALIIFYSLSIFFAVSPT